jgi:hypothetical protein
VDQLAYASSALEGTGTFVWAPCVAKEVERDADGAVKSVVVHFLGSPISESRPVEQVRFLFPENTLMNGEAGELQADEKAYVATAWKQRTGTKRIAEELNKRRAQRGGKVTRVSEKAVEAAVEDAKAALTDR